MTDLRDARFQRALDEAPDADLRPDGRVRAHILEAARVAVTQDKPASHWKKWWNFTGSPSPVWNAAFASVALATVVTLLWHDREIPDAGVTSPGADKHAPAPAVAPPAVVAQQAPAEKAKSAAESSKAPVAAEVAAAKKPKAEPRAAAKDSSGAPREEKRDARANLRDEAPAALGKVAPSVDQPAKAQSAAPPPAAPPAPVVAVPSPQPAIASGLREGPAAAAGQDALARSAGRAETRAFRAAPAFAPMDDNWTQAWIQSGGRGVRIERTQADRLPQLLASIARSGVAARAAGASQAVLRIELAAGTATDIVEVLEGQVRWTRLRDGQPREVLLFAPDAALLQALQAEAERLLGR